MAVLRRRTLLTIATVMTSLFAMPTWSEATVQSLPNEVVVLTQEARLRLTALRAERKFTPHGFPPFGYAGPDLPEDGPDLEVIVNQALDQILAMNDPQVVATDVRPILSRALEEADLFATEDRDRVWGYLIEIWYILGFRTTLFAESLGAGFAIPEGYAEPLPPGWAAPDQPRRIGDS